LNKHIGASIENLDFLQDDHKRYLKQSIIC
jgi:hypothetical protein